MLKIGYIRVSTEEQNEERQIVGMREQGIELQNMYLDKKSGRTFNRENYLKMKERIIDEISKNRDVKICVYFKELDRLGRNYRAINEEINWFVERNISLKFLDMAWMDELFSDTNNTMMSVVRDIVLRLMSYIAESEVEKTRKRQREAIDLIKADPVLRAEKYKGRKPIDYPENWEQFYKLYKNKSLKAVDCMKLMNLKKTTFYKLVKKYEEKH